MQAFFKRSRIPAPDLAQLPDAELDEWGQGVAHRQKIRTGLFEALCVAALLAYCGVAVGMIAWSFSSIVLPLSYMVGPTGLCLMILCGEGAGRCEGRKMSAETALLYAEKARRREREAPLSAPSALSPDQPSCADIFVDAVRNGIGEKVTVGRPLRLVKKASLVPVAGKFNLRRLF
jgi:hypothetical protein